MINTSLDWNDTIERTILWGCFLALFTDSACFDNRLRTVCIFDTQPVVFHTVNAVFLCTPSHDGKQVNVNIAVPRTRDSIGSSLSEIRCAVETHYPISRVNMSPLYLHLPDAEKLLDATKRPLPRTVRHEELTMDAAGRYVHYRSFRIQVVRTIQDRSELKDYKPLTLCNVTDWPGCAYWTRCMSTDGKEMHIVALLNPPIAFIEDGYVECDAKIDVSDVDMPLRIQRAVESLSPTCSYVVGRALLDASIPPLTRVVILREATEKLGLRDELIAVVSRAFTPALCKSSLTLEDMFTMSTLMRFVQGTSSETVVAKSLVLFLVKAQDAEVWRQWVVRSPFIRKCLTCFSIQNVTLLCTKSRPFGLALLGMLKNTIGHWTCAESEKAALVLRLVPSWKKHGCDVDVRAIRSEYARLERQSDRHMRELNALDAYGAADSVQAKEQHKTTASPKAGAPGTAPRKRDANDAAAQAFPEQPGDPQSVLGAIRSSFPAFKWQMIGSGIFYTAKDVDLVAEVPMGESAASLAKAYEAVREQTRFSPRYDAVDDKHVAVLCGVFDGRKVDVQVMREGGDTPAEHTSRSAVALTRSLLDGTTQELRVLVSKVHHLFDACSLKGHSFCRLPGIAVTCTAVVLGCRSFASLRGVLQQFQAALVEGMVVDFDAQVVRAPSAADCKDGSGYVPDAACVIVNERNVASRMIRATTLHVVELLSHACTLEDPLRVDVREWRRCSMFVALHLRARSARSISHSLHSALQRLQQHPIVETIHLDAEGGEGGEGGDGGDGDDEGIVLMCSLRSNARALRYTFQPSDAVTLSDDGLHVVVARDRREFFLCVTRREASPEDTRYPADDPRRPRRVSEALVVPNAPSLSVDAAACFDATAWTVVR